MLFQYVCLLKRKKAPSRHPMAPTEGLCVILVVYNPLTGSQSASDSAADEACTEKCDGSQC